MRYFLIVFLVLFLQAKDLKIMTEIFSPYQFKKDGKLVGISVDIVKEIQKKLNDNTPIKVYPWARGVKILDNKKNTMLFSMMKTPQREKKYLWVGPIAKLEVVFFKKKGSHIKLNSIEDAKKVQKIGVTRAVANYEILKSKGFKNLDVISGSDDKNIKKLLKNRIDLWPYVKAAGLYNAKKMGVSDKIVPINNVVLAQGDLYLAFNKNTDKQIVQKWQKAFDELVKSGEIEKIKRKYR